MNSEPIIASSVFGAVDSYTGDVERVPVEDVDFYFDVEREIVSETYVREAEKFFESFSTHLKTCIAYTRDNFNEIFDPYLNFLRLRPDSAKDRIREQLEDLSNGSLHEFEDIMTISCVIFRCGDSEFRFELDFEMEIKEDHHFLSISLTSELIASKAEITS